MIESGPTDHSAQQLLRIAIAHAELAAQHPDVERDRFLVEIAVRHLERVLAQFEAPTAA